MTLARFCTIGFCPPSFSDLSGAYVALTSACFTSLLMRFEVFTYSLCGGPRTCILCVSQAFQHSLSISFSGPKLQSECCCNHSFLFRTVYVWRERHVQSSADVDELSMFIRRTHQHCKIDLLHVGKTRTQLQMCSIPLIIWLAYVFQWPRTLAGFYIWLTVYVGRIHSGILFLSSVRPGSNQIFSVQFQELQVDREVLLTSNRSLAEESLSRRPRLQNGKLQLAAKYEELARLTTACREKQSQLGELKVALIFHCTVCDCTWQCREKMKFSLVYIFWHILHIKTEL